jgi:hypothetical protein
VKNRSHFIFSSQRETERKRERETDRQTDKDKERDRDKERQRKMMLYDENTEPQARTAGGINERTAGGGKKGIKGKNQKGTIEEMYQKKSQLEHILLRPDTYGTRPRLDCHF